MFDTLKEVLSNLIEEQEDRCSQYNPLLDKILLTKYKRAYSEYLQLVSFYETFSNEEDDQFE